MRIRATTYLSYLDLPPHMRTATQPPPAPVHGALLPLRAALSSSRRASARRTCARVSPAHDGAATISGAAGACVLPRGGGGSARGLRGGGLLCQRFACAAPGLLRHGLPPFLSPFLRPPLPSTL